jgi:hypothetical protein
MSINIGNFNNINRYDIVDNNLTLNTYTNSNVIFLNTNNESYEDTFINYKNSYYTGYEKGDYVINDNEKNNLFSLSYKDFNVNNYTNINNDININNIILTSNNTTTLNNNLNINLKNTSNFISIYDNNCNIIVGIINSNIVVNLNGIKVANISSNINLFKDLKFQDKNTLYINTLRSTSLSCNISIYNPILYGLRVVSSVFNSSISIINDKKYDEVPILVQKYNNYSNIIDLYTCNVSNITRQFCINENGFISIGSNLPLASIYIQDPPKNITSNVIFYDGFHTGDKFIVNNIGNVGIGTTNPKNLLQINRDDDLQENNTRKTPIIGLNLNYNPTSNYTTSNFIISSFYVKDIVTNRYDILDNLINSSIQTINNFNILYKTNVSVFQEYTSNIQNTIYVSNFENLNYENIIHTYPAETPLLIQNNYNFYIYTSLYFPNIFSFGIRNDNYNTNNFLNNKLYYNYYYNFNLMTKTTYEDGGYFQNINNFYIISSSNNVLNSYLVSITLIVNLYIEKSTYNYNFLNSNAVLQPPPYMMYATSNDSFAYSISSKGCLSLGNPSPNDNYYLYTNGNARIDNIECYKFKSISGKNNINFSDCNISNVNIIVSSSNICSNIYANNCYIDNLLTNNISINTQNTNNITSSNISFITLYSTSTNINNNNINFNVPVYIGNKNSVSNNNSYLQINVDNNYKNGITILNNYYGVNPTINISSTSIYSYPSLNLYNTKTNFSIKINSNVYNNINYVESFQIYNNTNNNNIIENISDYNILNIGTNNITLDLTKPQIITNSTNKISINYPFRYLIQNNYLTTNWSYYFYNNIINTPYMLNSYGSVNFSTINNLPIIKGFVNDINPLFEKVYIGLCGEPNNINNVAITGSLLATDNIITSNNIYVNNNCYITNSLYAGSIGNLSDIRIKTDLKEIKDTLSKINKITCYSYKRKDTGDNEIGLIAQEVQKYFPELVKNNEEIDLLHINYGNMTALLVNCINELSKKIDNIEKKISI